MNFEDTRITNTGIKFKITPARLSGVSVYDIGRLCDHVGTARGHVPLALYQQIMTRDGNAVYFAVDVASSRPSVYSAMRVA